ncbi:MAG: hypothetical protein KJS92_08670, partial [Bacteroidetes bacterium]|nr:hypothetical protein [Bacteroidota bacterium]
MKRMKNLAPRLFLCFASAFSVCAVHAQKGVSWLNELQQPCAKKHATYKQHVTQLPSGLYLKLLLDINGGDTLLRATYDHPSCKDMYRHGSYL